MFVSVLSAGMVVASEDFILEAWGVHANVWGVACSYGLIELLVEDAWDLYSGTDRVLAFLNHCVRFCRHV